MIKYNKEWIRDFILIIFLKTLIKAVVENNIFDNVESPCMDEAGLSCVIETITI